MSEPTPTISEIRAAYAVAMYDVSHAGERAARDDLHAQYEAAFDAAMAEHDRQVAERAWDEAAEIDAGCHDCIALGGYENPYRTEEESND